MSMLQIDADRVISQLVEAMLPAGSLHGLYIQLDARGSNHDLVDWRGKIVLRTEAEAEATEVNRLTGNLGDEGDEDEGVWPDECRASRAVHLIVWRPDNYTHVYATVDTSSIRPPADQFELLSCHDSCWREAFNEPLNRAYRAIKDECCPVGLPNTEWATWTGISRLDKVMVKVQRQRDVAYGPGRYVVASIENCVP